MNTEKIEVTELLEDGTIKEYVEEIATTSGKNKVIKVLVALGFIAAGTGVWICKKKKGDNTDDKKTEKEIKSLESKGFKIFKNDEVLDVVQVDVEEEEEFDE